jgi:cardiolipin synthase A/B
MSNHQKTGLKLLDARQYIADLTRKVSKAKKQVILMSLVLSDDELTHDLIEELIKAAKRGVKVDIAADVFTYGEFGGFFSPLKRRHPKSRAATEMAKKLEQAGAKFTWLGHKYKLNPFKGVTHSKWATVDDTSYIFGGVNVYKEGIESTDYMFRLSDTLLAKRIAKQHRAIVRSNGSQDIYTGYVAKTSHGTIYIDSGKPKDSPIYDRICELAYDAQSVLVVTQYCPTGTFAKHLKTRNSKIYYNQPQNTTFYTRLLISASQIQTGLRSLYPRKNYIHAKFILFTMSDGKQITITGSHNFTYGGVRFGTREVALETTDPSVAKQLRAFHKKHIA